MATPRVISNILYLLQALRDWNKRSFSGSYKGQVFSHLLYLLQQLHTVWLGSTSPQQGCIKRKFPLYWRGLAWTWSHVASNIWSCHCCRKDVLDAHYFGNEKYLTTMSAKFVADLMYLEREDDLPGTYAFVRSVPSPEHPWSFTVSLELVTFWKSLSVHRETLC